MPGKNVKEIVNNILARQGTVTNREIAEVAGISRQAVHRHLRAMVHSGELEAVGAGRGTRYRRPDQQHSDWTTFDTGDLSEDRMWEQMAARTVWLEDLSATLVEIMRYAFTEVCNNAIDHAASREVRVRLLRRVGLCGFEVVDVGVGIFDKIRTHFQLASRTEALQELVKGKVTTHPARHSGEGLFFVSRIADSFEIESGDLVWTVDNKRSDFAVVSCDWREGTRVLFELAEDHSDRLEDLFARYTRNFEFAVTRYRIKLLELGVRFVSRSEAKRLMRGLERFQEVILDFAGVEGIGQGFADEVFRVWDRDHPEVRLLTENMNQAVSFMVERARRNST